MTLVSEEPDPEYSACVLAHYVAGTLSREQALLKSLDDYAGIETLLGEHVLRIDPQCRTAELTTGPRRFDALILATGGSPVVPPVPGTSGPDVLCLKTLTDADIIAGHSAREAVVVGSGPTGVEVALALALRGVKVHLVEAKPSILPALFDPPVAKRVQDMLESLGIHVLTGESLTAVERDRGRIAGVRTSSLAVRCGLVVLTVGIRPRVELAAAAGLRLGPRGGVAVDEHMRTSVPAVYACGDCAEYEDVETGASALDLFWMTARQMGRAAGMSCMGAGGRYVRLTPSMAVTFSGLTIGAAGSTLSQCDLDGAEAIDQVTPRSYVRLVLREGALAGLQYVGRVPSAGPLATAIRAGRLTGHRTGVATSAPWNRAVECFLGPVSWR